MSPVDERKLATSWAARPAVEQLGISLAGFVKETCVLRPHEPNRPEAQFDYLGASLIVGFAVQTRYGRCSTLGCRQEEAAQNA